MLNLIELNKHNYPTNTEIDANLLILLEKINKVRDLYGIPMVVSSGLRSQEQQNSLIAAGKSNAPKSKHLTGQAVDILDPDKKLQEWCKENVDKLEEIGLWMEDFSATPNWVHFQIVPPHSGNRFFIP